MDFLIVAETSLFTRQMATKSVCLMPDSSSGRCNFKQKYSAFPIFFPFLHFLLSFPLSPFPFPSFHLPFDSSPMPLKHSRVLGCFPGIFF